MEDILKSKYHRTEPVRTFDVNQSMYDLVKSANEHNMQYRSSSYFISHKTFGQMIKESDDVASSLKKMGVKDNEIIGVCLLTVPEVSPVLLGINKVNAVSYWMDASLGEEDILKYINDNNIRILYLFEPLYDKVKKIIDKTNLEKVILVSPFEFVKNPFRGQKDDKRFITYSSALNQKSHDTIIPNYDKERPTVIVQSSGSTGKAKSIVHTDYNFNSAILNMAYTDLPFEAKRKEFVCAPPWVIYGLVNSIYSGMVFGQETVFSLMPQEDMLYKNLGKFDIAYGVPVYIRYLYNKIEELKKSSSRLDLKELERIKKELEKVKVIISGGDKLTEEEVIRWQQELGVPIINGYGNNEVVGAAIVSPMYANKPGSIGIPMHGNIVRAFDEEGKELPCLEEGELKISSTSLFKYYVGMPEETRENKTVYDGKEWINTGDRGYVDKDGYVFITGRIKRLIIDKLGYKISPENSENIIKKMPYVEDCCVVGAQLEENNTVPFAYVELKDEYKGNKDIISLIQEECSKHMKEYERPKIIIEIDKIPHKDNGGKTNFLLLEQMANEYILSHEKEIKLRLKK